eukprot:9843401-Lingulodinium_polyedra.AAC.1
MRTPKTATMTSCTRMAFLAPCLSLERPRQVGRRPPASTDAVYGCLDSSECGSFPALGGGGSDIS